MKLFWVFLMVNILRIGNSQDAAEDQGLNFSRNEEHQLAFYQSLLQASKDCHRNKLLVNYCDQLKSYVMDFIRLNKAKTNNTNNNQANGPVVLQTVTDDYGNYNIYIYPISSSYHSENNKNTNQYNHDTVSNISFYMDNRQIDDFNKPNPTRRNYKPIVARDKDLRTNEPSEGTYQGYINHNNNTPKIEKNDVSNIRRSYPNVVNSYGKWKVRNNTPSSQNTTALSVTEINIDRYTNEGTNNLSINKKYFPTTGRNNPKQVNGKRKVTNNTLSIEITTELSVTKMYENTYTTMVANTSIVNKTAHYKLSTLSSTERVTLNPDDAIHNTPETKYENKNEDFPKNQSNSRRIKKRKPPHITTKPVKQQWLYIETAAEERSYINSTNVEENNTIVEETTSNYTSAIVCGILGLLLFSALILTGIYFCKRREKNSKSTDYYINNISIIEDIPESIGSTESHIYEYIPEFGNVTDGNKAVGVEELHYDTPYELIVVRSK